MLFRSALTPAIVHAGTLLIFQGLFKKIILADFLAGYADAGFDHPLDANALTAALATYAFTFQIYFDFSGYTDIAIGCSKLLGISLPDNFRRPYVSSSITDFWRRWHISLSSWLRDYLYIPLGGNRMKSRLLIDRNLMLTMLLGGLWHGAAWHFVLWGGLQGAMLVAERRLDIGKADDPNVWGLRRWVGIVVTFHLACLSWIIFRVRDNAALAAFAGAFGRPATGSQLTVGSLLVVAIVLIGWASQIVGERNAGRPTLLTWPAIPRAVAYGIIAVAVTVLGSAATKPFIYFQF